MSLQMGPPWTHSVHHEIQRADAASIHSAIMLFHHCHNHDSLPLPDESLRQIHRRSGVIRMTLDGVATSKAQDSSIKKKLAAIASNPAAVCGGGGG